MIVVQVTDPNLRKAAVRAAHPEEDVVVEQRLAVEAIELGFPRLVIRDGLRRSQPLDTVVPVLEIDDATLRRWDLERRVQELPPTRLDHLTDSLRTAIEIESEGATWVDRAFGDLSRAAGARLPYPLRAFGRRVMEFPIHYTSLHPLAAACGTSRGAIKARFRRRGLTSPSTYLRWFRMMAVADLLSDRSVTVAGAARRLGFTSNGNLCRMMLTVTGVTPTEARTLRGWNRLLITFAWQHLSGDDLEGWAALDELFDHRAA